MNSLHRLLPLACLLTLPTARAGLADAKGIWQLNGNFDGAQPGHPPLQTLGLTNGTDYTFGTDGAGYQYLQTQVFTTAAKRLTATQLSGANGGPGATRTNQWTVVMDVKFDSVTPFAGLLQLDPANAQDVTFYLAPAPSGFPDLATLYAGGTALSWGGAVTKGAWQRIAITCGNDGAGGAPSLDCYINGVHSGFTRPITLNGPFSMESTFHLFSDNNAELCPAKVGFIGFWSEALTQADITKLGSPAPGGVSPYLLAYPDAPSTWGTWIEDVYYGFTPKLIGATTDPDGRLRAAFVNGRALAGTSTKRQALMLTYRRAEGGFRATEFVNLRSGLPSTAPYSAAADDDYVTVEATTKNLRTKIATADRGAAGFTVKARMIADYAQAPSGLASVYRSRFISPPAPFPYFPRKPWSRGDDYIETNYAFGVAINIADSLALSAAGSVTAVATGSESDPFSPNIAAQYKMAGQTLDAPFSAGINSTQRGRVFALDSALTDDGKDAYHLLSSAVRTGAPNEIRSQLTLVRQRITSPTLAGSVSTAPVAVVVSPSSEPNSVLTHPRILLSHATGEPKWIVWTDEYNAEVRAAKRVIPLPDGPPDDTNQARRISGGYQMIPTLDTFSSGSDVALDGLDRLHVVWREGVGSLVHYARENSGGGFDEIILPSPASGPPAIAIGPGDYPYIVYAGATAANPAESAPLIVTLPPGLVTAYRGDNEDRDADGRPGLIERAQSSSDTVAERGLELRQLGPSAGLATLSPGEKKFETGFRLRYNSTRKTVSSAPVWYQPDGPDTLEIQVQYSYNGMQSWNNGGFTLQDEFTLNNVLRYATVRDTATTTQQPRAFYRLQVKRIPGGP